MEISFFPFFLGTSSHSKESIGTNVEETMITFIWNNSIVRGSAIFVVSYDYLSDMIHGNFCAHSLTKPILGLSLFRFYSRGGPP